MSCLFPFLWPRIVESPHLSSPIIENVNDTSVCLKALNLQSWPMASHTIRLGGCGRSRVSNWEPGRPGVNTEVRGARLCQGQERQEGRELMLGYKIIRPKGLGLANRSPSNSMKRLHFKNPILSVSIVHCFLFACFLRYSWSGRI